MDELLPVLDEFVAAAGGAPNIPFWASACNLFGGSGIASPITGWVQVLFPYLTRGVCGDRWGGDDETSNKGGYERNPYLGEWRKSQALTPKQLDERGFGGEAVRMRGNGVELKNIPSGVSFVDFTCLDLARGKTHKLKFVGGLMSIVSDSKTGAISPEFGWAVVTSTGHTKQDE